MGKTQRLRRDSRHGQSTVEFMLMVPILFAILFFVIEMGLYFTTIHYGTYAAFATARAQQVGFNDSFSNVSDVSNLILTGAVWQKVSVQPYGGAGLPRGVSVSLNHYEELVPFPFIKSLLPSLDFDTRAVLGPDERYYEGVEGRPRIQYDNNNFPE